jgi:hypothetical protein
VTVAPSMFVSNDQLARPAKGPRGGRWRDAVTRPLLLLGGGPRGDLLGGERPRPVLGQARDDVELETLVADRELECFRVEPLELAACLAPGNGAYAPCRACCADALTARP